MARRIVLAAFGIVAAVWVLGGCTPSKGAGGGVVKVCAEVGQRCVHSPGKLGVCTGANETSCDAPPCLVCVSQH